DLDDADAGLTDHLRQLCVPDGVAGVDEVGMDQSDAVPAGFSDSGDSLGQRVGTGLVFAQRSCGTSAGPAGGDQYWTHGVCEFVRHVLPTSISAPRCDSER